MICAVGRESNLSQRIYKKDVYEQIDHKYKLNTMSFISRDRALLTTVIIGQRLLNCIVFFEQNALINLCYLCNQNVHIFI